MRELREGECDRDLDVWREGCFTQPQMIMICLVSSSVCVIVSSLSRVSWCENCRAYIGTAGVSFLFLHRGTVGADSLFLSPLIARRASCKNAGGHLSNQPEGGLWR